MKKGVIDSKKKTKPNFNSFMSVLGNDRMPLFASKHLGNCSPYSSYACISKMRAPTHLAVWILVTIADVTQRPRSHERRATALLALSVHFIAPKIDTFRGSPRIRSPQAF